MSKIREQIVVVKGDITKIAVDIIVNAANTSLMGGGGVDGAIHRAGGTTILEDCRTIIARQGSCKVGQAVYTNAGNLPCKYVIHTVGPVWNGGGNRETELLASAYLNTMKLAIELGCSSIAFPNISTGIYKFPKVLAAEIAFKVISDFLKESNSNLQVQFVCFDDENFDLYKKMIYKNEINLDQIKAALLGLSVGDALGVPVEFKSRKSIALNPVEDMIGFGTYNLEPGTWSDDSSLAFCLTESLTRGYNVQDAANTFASWAYEGHWTPRGRVFDIGIATSKALWNVKQGIEPILCGGKYEDDNGNGSLMRILPLLFHIKDMDIEQRFLITKEISSITHAHIRSVMACFYYLEFARKIVLGFSKNEAYEHLKSEMKLFFEQMKINKNEIDKFSRVLESDVWKLSEGNIKSNGYVISTLEASLWCFLNTESYDGAVLTAVNLGDDSDTTGAVTGGLAGLYYGLESIPKKWIDTLARKDDIDFLAQKYFEYINQLKPLA